VAVVVDQITEQVVVVVDLSTPQRLYLCRVWLFMLDWEELVRITVQILEMPRVAKIRLLPAIQL
jgi:hypothetical protein